MSESNERGGFSFQLSETPPPTRSEEQSPLGDLVLDLQDFGSWEDSPVEPSAVPPLSAPKPAEPLIEPAEPLIEPRVASKKPTPAREPLVAETVSSPRIKKIQFPAKKAASAASAKLVEKPKTRFSDSIAAPAVTARLHEEGDSEPPPRMERSESEGDLDLPEDLPGSSEGHAADDTWGSDTPTAKEIWNTARRTWQSTTRQAAILGGKGFRASQKAAQELGTKIKEHREASSKEREARAALEAASQSSAAAREGAPLEPLTSAESPPSAESRPRVSTRGNVIRPSARSLKKLAAPLSAVAAAALVYVVGTQLLGAEQTVSLSRASEVPEVPELGTLKGEDSTEGEDSAEDKQPEAEETRESASRRSTSRGAENPDSEESDAESPAIGAMKVEVTPMPDGLSWPGKGLIEVVTSEEELIYVDGVFTGRGPLRRIPVSPGEHEVSIRTGGSKRSGMVAVEINKNTRAVFKSE